MEGITQGDATPVPSSDRTAPSDQPDQKGNATSAGRKSSKTKRTVTASHDTAGTDSPAKREGKKQQQKKYREKPKGATQDHDRPGSRPSYTSLMQQYGNAQRAPDGISQPLQDYTMSADHQKLFDDGLLPPRLHPQYDPGNSNMHGAYAAPSPLLSDSHSSGGASPNRQEMGSRSREFVSQSRGQGQRQDMGNYGSTRGQGQGQRKRGQRGQGQRPYPQGNPPHPRQEPGNMYDGQRYPQAQYPEMQQGRQDPRSPQGQGQANKNKARRGQGQQNKNFKPFETYMSREAVQQGLKRGELIQGAIRINPKNYEDAYVPHPDGKSDIYLSGTNARNRALNGDIVVVELFDKDKWKVLVDDITAAGEDLLHKDKLSDADRAAEAVAQLECSADAEESVDDVVIEEEYYEGGASDAEVKCQDDSSVMSEQPNTAGTGEVDSCSQSEGRPEDMSCKPSQPAESLALKIDQSDASPSAVPTQPGGSVVRKVDQSDEAVLPSSDSTKKLEILDGHDGVVGDSKSHDPRAADESPPAGEIDKVTGELSQLRCGVDACEELSTKKSDVQNSVGDSEGSELPSISHDANFGQTEKPAAPNQASDDATPEAGETPEAQPSSTSKSARSRRRRKNKSGSESQDQGVTPTKQGGHGVTPKGGPGTTPTKQGSPRKKFTTLEEFTSGSESAGLSPGVRRLLEMDGAGTKTTAERDAVPANMLLRTGKVVYIVEQKHSRSCTGHIKLLQDRNKDTVLFSPVDHRMPRIHVPMADCPQGFYERPDDHAKTLFIARVTQWEEDSMFAKGNLARSLGEAGQIEPETEGMLIEYGVDYGEFSDEAVACLPTDLPWRIPQKELDSRRDLRQECIFTIDPATARDLDDALSVTPLGEGVYEVGVHIADVSYFVHPQCALDKVAASRATSVYMVQKVVPMLPRLLCEKLCSLNPDEDRLTFSVIWKITEEGQILDEWFGRSIIRSCVKLSYDHAQGFIDEPDRVWTSEELPPISRGVTVAQIRERVLNLFKISKHLRQARFDNGALRLDQVKLQFTLDKETGLPCGYSVYHQRDSNRLVEEFMLLANMAVARKIFGAFPEVATLRRHPPPQSKMVDDLVALCDSLGVPIDGSTSETFQQSIWAYAGPDLDNQARMQILTVLCSKPMQIARYFCTGVLDDDEMYRHYALNVPLYTHFTSPIRRYPDIMVHRLLAAALGYSAVPPDARAEVQKECEHCNDKKTNSKRVQELSSDLFFGVFVKECGPLEERGMVMAVLDKAFDVLVLSLGVVRRIYCEKLPLKGYSFRKNRRRPELSFVWAADKEHPREIRQLLTIFTPICCIITGDKDPLKWTAVMKHPDDQLAE